MPSNKPSEPFQHPGRRKYQSLLGQMHLPFVDTNTSEPCGAERFKSAATIRTKRVSIARVHAAALKSFQVWPPDTHSSMKRSAPRPTSVLTKAQRDQKALKKKAAKKPAGAVEEELGKDEIDQCMYGPRPLVRILLLGALHTGYEFLYRSSPSCSLFCAPFAVVESRHKVLLNTDAGEKSPPCHRHHPVERLLFALM